jgi:hypothetical protein
MYHAVFSTVCIFPSATCDIFSLLEWLYFYCFPKFCCFMVHLPN